MAIEWINEIDIDKIPKPEEGGGTIEKIIIDEETKALVEELKNKIDEQATTITNQAIAINKQNELLEKVDQDLDALVEAENE